VDLLFIQSLELMLPALKSDRWPGLMISSYAEHISSNRLVEIAPPTMTKPDSVKAPRIFVKFLPSVVARRWLTG
jgi:hypothetical protein